MRNIREKIKPTLNKVLSFFLLIAIAVSIITLVNAAAPNPGHTISQIGDVVQGDILYGSSTDAIFALAKNINATRYLSNTGASNNPAWAQIDLTNGVIEVLPSANGGTGIAFFTAAGPTVARTYTFPDAAATVLTSANAVTVAQGGTGQTTANNAFNALAPTQTGNAGKFLTTDGTDTSWSANPTFVVLGSDIINNNATANTIADVTGLSFSVTAGKRYHFKFIISYTSAAATTGSRWSINGPASPTFLAYGSWYTLSAITATNALQVAYDLPAASSATSLLAGNAAVIEGVIVPSANGTVIARFASESASVAITAKAGSTLVYWVQ